jgi:hypothetical protein
MVASWASLTSASATVPNVTTIWTTPLGSPAAFNESDAAAVNRASFVGNGMYGTTDVDGCLYVLNTTTGQIMWTYNEWPAVSHAIAQQRALYSGSNGLLVIRDNVAYGFDLSSGAVKWSKALGEGEGSWAWVVGDDLVLVGDANFQVWNFGTGEVAWKFADLWTPEYGALTASSGQIVALRRVWIDQTANEFNASVVVMNLATGAVLHHFPLTSEMVGDRQPQIFQFKPDNYILFYLNAAVVKVALPGGTIAWTRQLPFQPTSYGLGTPYIYLRTATRLASFELDTGAPVASVDLTTITYPAPIDATDKFYQINHLWGFDSFASLGLLFNRTDGSQYMAIYGLNGVNMTQRYLFAPPSASTMDDYGNTMSAGLIAIPSDAGLTLIGPRGNTWAATTAYPLMVPASLVLNTQVVVFTSGAAVTALQLPSPSL